MAKACMHIQLIDTRCSMNDLNCIILRQLKKEKIDSDIEINYLKNKAVQVVYFYKELDYYTDKCLFGDCTENEMVKLLLAFCSPLYSYLFSWQVCCELSKLLAKKGKLISRIAENFIFPDKTNHFRKVSLHLSYLATDTKWEKYCLSCIDLCEEDLRDGLFLACYRLNTFDIYTSLVKYFSEWIKKDPDWGNGTGEYLALERFIKKWNLNPTYRLHFKLQKFIEQVNNHAQRTWL